MKPTCLPYFSLSVAHPADCRHSEYIFSPRHQRQICHSAALLGKQQLWGFVCGGVVFFFFLEAAGRTVVKRKKKVHQGCGSGKKRAEKAIRNLPQCLMKMECPHNIPLNLIQG